MNSPRPWHIIEIDEMEVGDVERFGPFLCMHPQTKKDLFVGVNEMVGPDNNQQQPGDGREGTT